MPIAAIVVPIVLVVIIALGVLGGAFFVFMFKRSELLMYDYGLILHLFNNKTILENW